MISRTTSGLTGTTPVREDRTVSATTYDGLATAAFDPGGTFDPAWLSLPQPVGHVKQTDGPRTDVADFTQSVYYPSDASVPGNLRGRLAATRNAAGQIVRHEAYDTFGNITRTVDPNGLVTETAYDYLGRPVTTAVKGVAGCDTAADPVCATDVVTTRVYHPGGGPLVREERASSVTVYAYDAKGRVASISRGPSASDLREKLEYGYDTSGRKTSEKTFAFESGVWVEKRSTSFEYDTEGRLTATVHPDGARVEYAYDASHDLVSVKDENHVAPNTFYEYDPASRLTEVRQSLGVAEVVTAYGYDAHGNLTSVTDPNGNVTSYLYDDFGQMLRQVSPVTGTTTYLYDAAGNMTSTTDATGATTTRSYDVLGRPVSAVSVRSGAPSEQVSWTYDTGPFGVGRLARMDDPTGFTTYTWTRLGHLAREDKSVAGAIWTSTFQYDLAGNRSLIGYPSGRQVTYGYDFAGRQVSATDGATPLVTSANYLPFGPMTALVYGNGTTKGVQYDTRYRPTVNTVTGPGGTIASYGYAYDPAGNITAIDDLADPRYDRTFGYDDLHRLTEAGGGPGLWGSGTYQYDAMGNMISLTLGGNRTASFVYSGTTPKLTSVSENGIQRTVQYDPVGNEIVVGASNSSYSARNHLAGADGLAYAYDGRGVRTITTGMAPGVSGLSFSPSELVEGATTVGTVQLDAAAPSGGALVQLSVTDTRALQLPPSVLVPAGSASADFSATALKPLPVTVTAARGATQRTAQVQISVLPRELTSVTVDPSTVVGGDGFSGTVTINRAALQGGAAVALSSSDPGVSIPSDVTVPEGQLTASFAGTSPVKEATETVSIIGTLVAQHTASLTITETPVAAAGLAISPETVDGGSTATGTVSLNRNAAAGGAVVQLSSSDPAAATVPSSVTIEAGQNTGTFAIQTTSVSSDLSVVITAALGQSAQGELLVMKVGARVQSIAIAPDEVVGGRMHPTGTVTLTEPAPPAGAVVGLTSSATTIADVPTSVTVSEGSIQSSFPVTTSTVSTAVDISISGVYGGTEAAQVRVASCGDWVGNATGVGNELVWFDDAPPSGAQLGGDWLWDTVQKTSGVQSHHHPAGAGASFHWFTDATPLAIHPGDTLVTYVLIDPCAPPGEIMLQFRNGSSWEHRAYWGQNLFSPGVDGTSSQRPMGALPELGRWVRLEVPASLVGLEGESIHGISFTIVDGHAWFDRVGIVRCSPAAVEPTIVATDQVWFDDVPPLGAQLSASWRWSDEQKASGSLSHDHPGLAGPHYHWFTEATETLAIAAGDTLITYVLLDPCDPPREVMLQFRNGTSWEHRAYWGENLFLAGVDGTDSRRPMGPLPPAGEWIRLEVPANLVGLEGETIHGISFTLVDGHAWFDRVGKAPGSTGSGDGEAIPEASGKRPPAPGDLDSSQGKTGPISLAGDGKVWFDLTGKIAATGGAAVGVVATGSHKTAQERIETEPAAGDESLTISEETNQEGVQTDSPEGEGVPISLLVDADFLEPVTGHGSGDAQRISIYSPELQLLTESEFTTTTPAPAWDYVYFAGQPVAQIEVATGATRWTFNDHLGTPVLQTDAAGAVAWRLEQEPYGSEFAFRAGSSLHQPLTFPGQERGVESEFAYNVFRWYRGGWGRYSQADPIGVDYDSNVFRYAAANPVAFVDKYGLAPEPWKSKCKNAPPLKSTDAKACQYGDLAVNHLYVKWKLDCVCKKMGDQPSSNCVRGCVQCAKDHGAAVTSIGPHLWCRNRCKQKGLWKHEDTERLNKVIYEECAQCWFILDS